MLADNFTPAILRFDTLDSTNLKAKELARAGTAGEGSVVLARFQTAGRGRGANRWHSPEGGLFLSALLYPKGPRRLTDLPLLVGVAVAQAVKHLLPKSVDVTLKWPNDVLVNWKKVGGILCESLGEECFNLSVAGIGLNVNVPPGELHPFRDRPFGATSFVAEAPGRYDTEEVLKCLLTKLFTLYRLYHEQGMEPIRYLWERNCAFIGKQVELADTGVTVGTFLGIDDSGGVVLSNAKGERRAYYTGAITCYWP